MAGSVIPGIGTGAGAAVGGVLGGTIGAIVGGYKAAVSRNINKVRPGAAADLWQRNYYEHIVRYERALDSIRESLADDGVSLRSLMTEHLATIDTRLAAEHRLRGRLVTLVGTLESDEDTTGDLLSVLEDMTMLETTVNRRIAILVYEDLEAAFDYLIRVFGFGPGELMRDPDGNVVHAEIQAGDGEFWLHMESEAFTLRSPKHLGGASGTMAVMVDDVDAHHRYAVEQGADIRYAPVDQDYGYREYSAVDPEGHLWSFMKPLD